MKAENIVRLAQGQVAGGIARLRDVSIDLHAIASVADDVACGITPIKGLRFDDAHVLSTSLSRVVRQLGELEVQLVTGYGHLLRLANRLPPPDVDLL